MLRTIRNAAALLLIAALCHSCGASARLQEEMKDPEKTLQVRIESEPSGAEVYGIKGGKRGTLLGTTPLICSYMVVHSGHAPDLLGSVPVSETIVNDFGLTSFAHDVSYYKFQCLVVKDGYLTAHVLQELKDDKPINARNFGTSDVFTGGRRVDILVELPPADQADSVRQGAEE